MSLLRKAEVFAKHAHAGQVDKAGVPYWRHLEAVASMVYTVDAKVVAWLHDVIEDTPATAQDLLNAGFPSYIVEAVLILTHTHEHTHADYVRTIRDAGGYAGELARAVKRADLRHNSDPRRSVIGLEHLKKRYDTSVAILDGDLP